MAMPVYRFEDLPTVQHNPNLSSNKGETIKGERMYFCHRKRPAGSRAEPHHHPCEQFIYILKGRQRFTIDGEEFQVAPGDVIHVPANAVHSTIADEDMETLYVKDTSWSLKGVPAGQAAPEKAPEDDPF
jgi:quercetin dioxygenase-like cupin family protein